MCYNRAVSFSVLFVSLGLHIIIGMEGVPDYPVVQRDETVVEDYHGTLVADPYRWLETLDSEETRIFMESQTSLTNEFLAKLPAREHLRAKLTQLINYPKYSAPIRKGNQYFDFFNLGLQNHDIFRVREDINSKPRVLVDPNGLSENGSIGMGYARAVSPKGKVFVYTLSQSGSDWLTASFVNVTSGLELPDKLEFIKWPDFSWTLDGLGLFYSRFPVNADGTPVSEGPQIYYHALGTGQDEDTFITQNSEHPKWFLMAQASDDGKYLLVKPQPDFKANGVQMAKLRGSGLTSELRNVFSVDQGSRFIYVTNEDNSFIFLTNHEAPNFRLIRTTIHLNSEHIVGNIEVLVPEHEKNILKWVSAFDEDKLLLCYLEDVKHKLEAREMETGCFLQQIPLGVGIISDYSISKENNEFFFKFENFVTPGIIYRCISTGRIECTVHRKVELGSVGINLNDFSMNQVFYPSKDGTLIPMYIAHKKDLVYDGRAPTLLHGYGGFNVDLLPTFSPFNIAFIDHFNGVFASPNLRGGAEYGEKWHQDGMLLNKQNTFDDFQAGAEYLIEAKYTSPSMLTIQGSSNGGLLVGACVNQRPDLFSVALPDVGLLDMLRFHKFTIGYAWCSEYGCSDNKTHFENLMTYSPLHNIKLSQNRPGYPAILVSLADSDDRVVPSHSFKYVSQLQHSVGLYQGKPILLRIEKNAGHNGEDKPTNKKIADYVDAFSFIDANLKRA